MGFMDNIKKKYFNKPESVQMDPMVQKAFTVMEIAEKVGIFPSEVESIMVQMVKGGKAKAWWYQHKMYITLNDGVDLSSLIYDFDPMVG